MRMKRGFLAVAALWATSGCASLPTWWPFAPPAQPPPPGRARLEFLDSRYDGLSLSGRFLVGATEGPVRLDKRLIENLSVNVKSVATCGTSEPLGFFITDSFAPPPKPEDLLVVTPGHWYGVDFDYPLFDERKANPPKPDCIEVTLSLNSFDRTPLGELRVRAERASSPPVEPQPPSP